MNFFITCVEHLEELQYWANWMLSIIFLIFSVILIYWIYELIKKCRKDKSLSIKTHIKNSFKKYSYLLIAFVLFLTNFLQVSIIFYWLNQIFSDFGEVVQQNENIPDWYFALVAMNSFYVLIIITLAIFLIWISFWKKKVVISWIVLYYIWLIIAFLVPTIAYSF